MKVSSNNHCHVNICDEQVGNNIRGRWWDPPNNLWRKLRRWKQQEHEEEDTFFFCLFVFVQPIATVVEFQLEFLLY